jgi:hypothetical protein
MAREKHSLLCTHLSSAVGNVQTQDFDHPHGPAVYYVEQTFILGLLQVKRKSQARGIVITPAC